MSELICLIARRLAELDGKNWDELNVPQQAKYMGPSLMAADAAAQYYAARGHSLYNELPMPSAGILARIPAAHMMAAE